MRFLRLSDVSVASLFMVLGLSLSAAQAQAQEITCERIVGLQQTAELVGVGTDQITGAGAAPWTTTDGVANVDLARDEVQFKVQGLVLAVGSAPAFKLFGLGIGTTAGVPGLRAPWSVTFDGTVGSSGQSAVVDTDAVALDAQGNARFVGQFATSIPAVCNSAPEDMAFLIRIVEPIADANLYIAFGAVLVPQNEHTSMMHDF